MTACVCIKQHTDFKPASHQLQAVSLLMFLFSLKNFEVFTSQREKNPEETYKQAWAQQHTTVLMYVKYHAHTLTLHTHTQIHVG